MQHIPFHNHSCSKPTVWDGDSIVDGSIVLIDTVLSPLCGMETAVFYFSKIRYRAYSSKPTVWDGDSYATIE